MNVPNDDGGVVGHAGKQVGEMGGITPELSESPLIAGPVERAPVLPGPSRGVLAVIEVSRFESGPSSIHICSGLARWMCAIGIGHLPQHGEVFE